MDLEVAREDDHRDDRQGGLRGVRLQERPSVHDGHHQVEQDEARRVVAAQRQDLQRAVAVLGERDAVTLVAQHLDERAADPGVVVDDQDLLRVGSSGLGEVAKSVADWQVRLAHLRLRHRRAAAPATDGRRLKRIALLEWLR
jgi:hypothetical protein